MVLPFGGVEYNKDAVGEELWSFRLVEVEGGRGVIRERERERIVCFAGAWNDGEGSGNEEVRRCSYGLARGRVHSDSRSGGVDAPGGGCSGGKERGIFFLVFGGGWMLVMVFMAF